MGLTKPNGLVIFGTMKLIAPIVHLNGDTQDTLLENHCEAMQAIRDAISKLPECNPRNYYPISAAHCEAAQDQRMRWTKALDQILREIECVTEHIADKRNTDHVIDFVK